MIQEQKQFWLLPMVIALFANVTLFADSVELTGSGQLTGKVARKGDLVIVRIDDDIQVALPGTRVSRVVESEQLAKYKSLAKQVGDDANAHYQLARWCKAAGNVPGLSQYYTRFHMQRAVELNPNHAEARASLGYTKDEGKWILKTDLMRSRGMIFKSGRWVIPEAASLEATVDESEKEAKLWIREIAKLVKIVMKGNRPENRKYNEAFAELNSIKDPLAAIAIAQQFENSRATGGRGSESQPLFLRRLWITLLGRFQTATSVRALVKAGIDEPNPDLRDMALDRLLQYGSGTAIANYKRTMLSSKSSNELINRAARALLAFPADRELAMQYINALVTTHTQEIAPSGNMNATFGGAGGGLGGMSSGSKAKRISQTLNNPSVLSLVKKTIPEVDFGYDEVEWRNYLANQKLGFSGDLRRDP
jgi:hypothetical protein